MRVSDSLSVLFSWALIMGLVSEPLFSLIVKFVVALNFLPSPSSPKLAYKLLGHELIYMEIDGYSLEVVNEVTITALFTNS